MKLANLSPNKRGESYKYCEIDHFSISFHSRTILIASRRALPLLLFISIFLYKFQIDPQRFQSAAFGVLQNTFLPELSIVNAPILYYIVLKLFTATVECYEFAKKKWGYVSSLPYRTMPERCYVDTYSSPTTKLFVSGQSYNEEDIDIDGAYSYCTSNDTWEEVDVTSYQSPVLPRPLKWMWCTGTMLFKRKMMSYKEWGDDAVSDDDEEEVAVSDDQAAAVVSGEEAVLQFPSEITILQILLQH